MKVLLKSVVAILMLFIASGCSQNPTNGPTASATASSTPRHEDHEHHHKAPHGGTLIELGEEFAHLEILLDADSGTLTAYVLDGEAETPVRLPGTPMLLALSGGETVTLVPVVNELTGETETDSATYRAVVESLKGSRKFEGVVKEVSVRGSHFTDVVVSYHQGNEGEHEENEEHHQHKK